MLFARCLAIFLFFVFCFVLCLGILEGAKGAVDFQRSFISTAVLVEGEASTGSGWWVVVVAVYYCA